MNSRSHSCVCCNSHLRFFTCTGVFARTRARAFFSRVCTCVRTLVLPVLTHIRARAHAFTCTSTRTRICTHNCTRARPQTFHVHDHARNPRVRTTRCTRTTTPMFTRWTTGTTERTHRDPQHRTRHPSRTHLVTLARSSSFVVGRERSAADVDYVVCQVWNAYRGPQDAAILPVLLPREVLFALYGQHGSCDARPFNGWKAIDRFGRRGHDRDRAIARRCGPQSGAARRIGHGHDGVARTDRTLESAARAALRRASFLGVEAPDDGRCPWSLALVHGPGGGRCDAPEST